MKHWRPEDWKNPTPDLLNDIAYDAYEDGADAILEALRKHGEYTDGMASTLSINVRPEQKGWLVFIPDKED